MFLMLCCAVSCYALHDSTLSCAMPCCAVQAVFRSILATSAGRPELMSRLAAGLLLIGPGGGLRGLGSMLERRVGQRFSKARQPQVRLREAYFNQAKNAVGTKCRCQIRA